MLCRHCQARPGYRARGLCRFCFYDLAVRALYPCGSLSRRGIATDNVTPSPCRPTAALPGTHAKLATLEGRCERGEALWHRLDPVLSSRASDESPRDPTCAGQRRPNGERLTSERVPDESGCRRVRVLGERALSEDGLDACHWLRV
jgi:hypothetical protein